MADEVYISKEDFEKVARKEGEFIDGDYEVVDNKEVERTLPGVSYYELILKRKSDGKLFGSGYWYGGVYNGDGVEFVFDIDANKNSDGLYKLHEYRAGVITETKYYLIEY